MVLNLVLYFMTIQQYKHTLGVRLRRDVLLQESRILRIAASQLIVDIATSHHLVLLSAIAGNINLDVSKPDHNIPDRYTCRTRHCGTLAGSSVPYKQAACHTHFGNEAHCGCCSTGW